MGKSISLCIISKDEEDNLERCLKSVQGLVQEIVLVDTGSKDRTKDIANSFGAKILDVPWCDDFSVSRNASIEAATSDWILVLDADETLDSSDFVKLRTLIEQENVCYQLIPRNYNNKNDVVGFEAIKGEYPHWEKGLLGYIESNAVRLFPKDDRIKYRNCMHELVEPSIHEIPDYRIVNSGIRIHHFGQQRAHARKEWKKDLYGRLALKKTQEDPNHWKAHYEFGLGHVCAANFQQAIAPLLKAIELDPMQIESWLTLGQAYGELGNYSESESCLKKAIEINPNCAQAFAHLGVVYMKIDKFHLAAELLQKAIKLNPSDFNAYLNLGDVFLNLQQFKNAAIVFHKTLEMVSDNARGLLGFGVASLMLKDFAGAEKSLLKIDKTSEQKVIADFWLSKLAEIQSKLLLFGT